MIVTPWETVINVIQTIAGSATAIALFFTIRTFLRVRKTEQLKIVESIFRDIRSLENNLINIVLEPKNDRNEQLIRNWRSQFFNTLEWFSFLVNIKEVKNPDFLGFFKDAIIDWHDNIFEKYMGDAVTDPKQYPEFKKLYNKWANSKTDNSNKILNVS